MIEVPEELIERAAAAIERDWYGEPATEPYAVTYARAALAAVLPDLIATIEGPPVSGVWTRCGEGWSSTRGDLTRWAFVTTSFESTTTRPPEIEFVRRVP